MVYLFAGFASAQTSALPDYGYAGKNLISSFRTVKYIPKTESRFGIPVVVEFPVTAEELTQKPFLIFDAQAGKAVYHFIKTNQGEPPVSISTSSASLDLQELHDSRTGTYYEKQPTGSDAVFFYKSAVPVTASSIKITLSPNAFKPERVSIFNYSTPGNLSVVASQVPFNNGIINFPRNTSNNWQIVFSHTQPLRIAEFEVVAENTIVQEYSVLRFLAEPGREYRMYLSPDRAVTGMYTEYIRLDDPVSNLVPISAPQSLVNIEYKKADSDSDGLPDETDNCPQTANADQIDKDNNKTGDACEDFDRDGIMNVTDNCPDSPNGNQRDADSDGFGDVCDPEESRLTERIWWLPWVGILVGFGTVGFILKSTVQAKKKSE